MLNSIPKDIKVVTVHEPEAIATLTQHLIEEFTTHGLAKEVTDHLWLLPLASIYGGEGKPFIGTNLRSIKGQFIAEIDYFPEQREAQARALDFELEEFDAFEKRAYDNLFKGLCKTLPAPIILSKLDNLHAPKKKLKGNTATTAHPTIFIPDDFHVPFNPKNLQRHYGYKDTDAKTFFKNFRNYFGDEKVFLLKKEKLQDPKVYLRNIFILNIVDDLLAMWSYSQDIDERRKVESNSIEYIEEMLSITKHELPIQDLQTWKEIAEKWFERIKGESWSELDIKSRQRHIVNVIRHNSVAYDRTWRHVRPDRVREFHAAAFDRTLRQIMNAFPWLAEECKRQLNSRKI